MAIPDQQRLLSASFVKEKAKQLGFYACGISPAQHLEADEQRVEQWLDEGMHADMQWMEKNREKRYDPSKLVEGARSVVSVLYPYATKEKLPEENNYKISMYAYGNDYHGVVKDKLHQLLHLIEEKAGKRKARVFVDSAPVLDRAWAHKSELGFIGKNTMLINRKGGSYFFIGHLVIDLQPDEEKNVAEKNYCGSCTLCIKACPTDALTPFRLDARKCISYHTIENKGKIPESLKGKFNDWIFGCDICQDACPWNREPATHDEPQFKLTDELVAMRKDNWQNLNKEKFDALFNESAVRRAGYEGLKRNISFLNG